MELNVSNIETSKQDQVKGITFPEELTLELAELIGIIVGDGHLVQRNRILKSGYSSLGSDLIISGNSEETGHLDHINYLFKATFNFDLFRRKDKRSKSIALLAHSKGLVNFLSKCCQIKIGKKVDCCNIPRIIKKSPLEFKYAFLRGLADTDFTISFKKNKRKCHSYPVIRASFKSKNLIEDLESFYQELDFKYSTIYDLKKSDKRFKKDIFMNEIYLNGKNNFELWLELIGFSHPKIKRRIEKWQKDGECPPGY